MNKSRIFLIWGLLLAVTHVMGYTITVNPIEIQAGQSTNLVINLSNTETNLTAYQLSLYLPGGVTIQKNTDGDYSFMPNDDRHNGAFTFSVKDAADGSILITCYSLEKDVLTDNSGELIRLPIDVAPTASTPLQGSIKNIEFTDINANAYNTSDVKFNITVTKPSATVVTAPTAKTLTYTGSAQQLVNAGVASGGTMQYSLNGTTYGNNIPTGTNAGNYTVYYKVVGDQSHSDTDPETVSVTISKAAASITTVPTAKTLTYTGAAQQLVNAGKASGGTMQYSLDGTNYGNNIPTETNAGSYTVYYKVEGDANHNDTDPATVSVTIKKAPLTISGGTYMMKQGEELPAFTAIYTGFVNNETEDVLTTKPTLTTTATSASEPGDYAVTVSGAEAQNYEITYEAGTLTITEAEAEAITVTVKNASRMYGDANPVFEYEISGGTEEQLGGTPELTCEAVATSTVGEYAIKAAKGTATYPNIVFVNGTLTVTKAPLTISGGTYTMKQGEALPTFTPTYTGFKNDETEEALTTKPTLTTTATSASEPGEYAVTVSGAKAQNYVITYEAGTLTIGEADAITLTAQSHTIKYGDALPDFGFTSEGATLDGTPSITCEATSASPVGTYPIVITKGSVTNYNDHYVNGTLTIEKAPLTISGGTYTIKQGENLPTFTPTYTGFKNDETEEVLTTKPTLTTEATSASEPGEYAVTVSGAEAQNYAITYEAGTLTIVEADAVTLTAQSYTITYGGVLPEFNFTSEGAAVDGTPSITCEATSASPVGTYPIVITKGSVTNYNDHYVNGTLTIEKAPLTINAGTYTMKQGDNLPAFTPTYTGFKNGETEEVLTTKPTLTTEATSASEPGEYEVTVSGAEAANYAITYEAGTLTIAEADAITIIVDNASREYGDANPVFDYEIRGGTEEQLGGTLELTCEAVATSTVGEYDIKATKGTTTYPNIVFISGTLTVTKAPLTISGGSYTMKQAEALPTFTPTYTGFKNGETEEVLTTKPTLTTEATSASEPGEYEVTVSGAEAANYAITYEAGTLTIAEADAITIIVDNASREYGDANPVFDYEIRGGTEEQLGGTLELTCEAVATSTVGEYAIEATKGTTTYPNIIFINGTLTITKAPLTISCGNYTMKQGEALPSFTATYTGFKNNDTEEVLSTKPTLTTEATSASEPGEYEVTVSGAESQNYEITYETGTLTIAEADVITVIVNNASREYGDENPAFDYEIRGGTEEQLGGTLELTCEAVATSTVGEYAIKAAKGTATYPNIVFVNGTLTVTKAPLTISGGSYTIKQGDELPAFTASYEGFKNNETANVLTNQPTISTTATSASSPGTYEIKVSGASATNYNITYVKGTLTIAEADAIIVIVKNASREYGDANPTFDYEISGGTEEQLGGTLELICEAVATSTVGEYAIKAAKGTATYPNIVFVNGTLTITKAPLTISGGTYTMKQGDNLPAFTPTYTGFKNNETEEVLTTKPTLTTEATSASEPGKYEVTVSGAEAQNYEITYEPGTLTIIEADAITVIVKNASREYGEANPVFDYEIRGGTEEQLGGTPKLTCEALATSAVGEYAIKATKGTTTYLNIVFVNATLTVTKAPLTINGGTYTMKQGENLPTFTPTYTGFKNGETEEVLTTKPTLTTEATSASEPGEYEVTVSGAEAQNYEITYETGRLTIGEADAITLTAQSYTIKYGDALPDFGFTSEGAALDGTPSITCEATSASPVGTYPIVITKGSVTNYNDHYVNGTLTIEKAPLTISAGTYTMKQGDNLPAFTPTYTGFKNGETEEVLTTKPTLTTEATSASEPGDYEVTVSGAEAANYEITYEPGTLTIAEADPVTVIVKNASREYGDENPDFEYEISGGTEEQLGGALELTCEAVAISAVGEYAIKASKGTATYPNIVFVDGTLTIEKAPLTISGGTYTIKQGEDLPAFTPSYIGFKNNETEEVLTTKPTLTTEATSASEPGEYEVTVSGAEAVNYEITYEAGTLTITEVSGIHTFFNENDNVNDSWYTIDGRKLQGKPTQKGVYIRNGVKVVIK